MNHRNLWKANTIPHAFLWPGTSYGESTLWHSSDTEENYYLRGNTKYGPKDITYNLNTFGYRSREIDPESKYCKIMFVGCSFTFGSGLPLEEVWTTQLTKMIGDHYNIKVEQHNFGQPAHGIDTFARIVYQVAPILRPDFVAVLLTSPFRQAINIDWENQTPFLASHRDENFAQIWKGFVNVHTDAQAFFEYVRHFAFIRVVLSSLNIPVIWQVPEAFENWFSTRDIEWADYISLAEVIESSSFRNFDKPIDFARDGLHPGFKTNRLIAESFFEECVSRRNIDAAFKGFE